MGDISLSKMKLLSAFAVGILAQKDCEWHHGKSGQHVSCLLKYYAHGLCGSGSRNDCRFLGDGKFSFGIQCCPEDEKDMIIGDRENCNWIGNSGGNNTNCADKGKAVFGACQTSKTGGGGHCNKTSHQVECCESNYVPDIDLCGWIYDTYGAKITCPKGMGVAAMCGVNNKGNCDNGNAFAGVRCCPPAKTT